MVGSNGEGAKDKRISIRLPRWLYDRVVGVSKAEERSITDVVITALKHTYAVDGVYHHAPPPHEG